MKGLDRLRPRSGTLPFEDGPQPWKPTIEAALNAARRPLDELIGLLSGGVELPRTSPSGSNLDANAAFLALLAKLAKGYRGMLLLCEHGLGHEGIIILRSVLETAAACRWLLRAPDCSVAALQMRAHDNLCLIRMASEAKEQGTIDLAQKALEQVRSALGDAYEEKALLRHYSKLGGFQSLCKALGWEQHYTWVYRSGSGAAHVSDVSDHLTFHEDGGPSIRIGPGPLWVPEALSAGSRIMSETLADVRQRSDHNCPPPPA